jgi:hypothetical protein
MPGMKYRKLRIACSVSCGVLAVLFVIVWAVSFWRAYILWSPHGVFCFAADYGALRFSCRDPIVIDPINGWELDSRKPVFDPFENFPMQKPSPLEFRFDYISTDDIFIQAPGWSLSSFAVALAAIPWLRSRFSLRTLLIATTVIAVGLGVIVWAAN